MSNIAIPQSLIDWVRTRGPVKPGQAVTIPAEVVADVDAVAERVAQTRRRIMEMRGVPVPEGWSARCHQCGAALNAEEQHYYEVTCERCEGENHARIEREIRQPDELAAEALALARELRDRFVSVPVLKAARLLEQLAARRP